MVFCYKILTAPPSRIASPSPTRKSPIKQRSKLPALSDLIYTLDYESSSNGILDSIPEREWRLLAALAKKREEDDERERLADQFRKMWQKEKEERQIVEAETTHQYKKYIGKKRAQEKMWHESRRLQKSVEHQIRTGHLVDCIRYKERKAADLRASNEDRKISDMIDKAIVEETRAVLAAEKRTRLGVADEWRRKTELYHGQKRVDDARRRRYALLRDSAQKAAISNALSNWESSILRREVDAMEDAKKAHHLAQVALREAKTSRFQRAKDSRKSKARQMAELTAKMREELLQRRY